MDLARTRPALAARAKCSALLAVGALLCPIAGAADPAPDLQTFGDEVMGTTVSVSIWGLERGEAQEAARAVFAEFRRLDELMSSWREGSDIARLNEAAGGDPVELGDEVYALLERSVEASRATGGAFDVTVGAFRGLWRFDEDLEEIVPTDEEIEARVSRVGYEGIELAGENTRARLAEEGMRVTLGGIAKGYGVDRAVDILRDRGASDFILQAGGDLYVSGERGERAWRVGVRDPRGAPDAMFAVLELGDAAFSTSGDYERGFVEDGERYHHILNPETGRPARENRSVTVLAESALDADIWSTSLFVLGPEEGLEEVEEHRDIEAVFVDADNQVHVSSGLADRLHILRPPTDAP